MDHRADPLEMAENAEVPMLKLTRFYTKQTSALEERIRELEGQLNEARKALQAAPLSATCGSVPGAPSAASPHAVPSLARPGFAMEEVTAIHLGTSMLASPRVQCSPRAQKHVEGGEVTGARTLSPRVLFGSVL